MNHQDIADRFRALGQEESAALQAEEARIQRERESLRELCGGIGHIYTAQTRWIRIPLDGPQDPLPGRACMVCGRAEP